MNIATILNRPVTVLMIIIIALWGINFLFTATDRTLSAHESRLSMARRRKPRWTKDKHSSQTRESFMENFPSQLDGDEFLDNLSIKEKRKKMFRKFDKIHEEENLKSRRKKMLAKLDRLHLDSIEDMRGARVDGEGAIETILVKGNESAEKDRADFMEERKNYLSDIENQAQEMARKMDEDENNSKHVHEELGDQNQVASAEDIDVNDKEIESDKELEEEMIDSKEDNTENGEKEDDKSLGNKGINTMEKIKQGKSSLKNDNRKNETEEDTRRRAENELYDNADGDGEGGAIVKRESLDNKESNDSEENKSNKDKSKGSEESKDSKGSEESKDSKGSEESKDSKGSKESEDSKGSKESKDNKGSKESEDSKGSKESKDSKDMKESKDNKGSKESEDSKGSKESKDSKDIKERKDSKVSKESKDNKGRKDWKEDKGGRGAEDKKHRKENNDIKESISSKDKEKKESKSRKERRGRKEGKGRTQSEGSNDRTVVGAQKNKDQKEKDESTFKKTEGKQMKDSRKPKDIMNKIFRDSAVNIDKKGINVNRKGSKSDNERRSKKGFAERRQKDLISYKGKTSNDRKMGKKNGNKLVKAMGMVSNGEGELNERTKNNRRKIINHDSYKQEHKRRENFYGRAANIKEGTEI